MASEGVVAHFNGHYITPSEGYTTGAAQRAALEDSLQQTGEYDSNSCVDRDHYKTYKMLGFNCAKVPSNRNILKNGVNGRQTGNLTIRVDFETPLLHSVRANVWIMYRRIARLAEGKITTMD